jgi:hypothetical protein
VFARDWFLRWRTREHLDRFAADIRALAQYEPDLVEVPIATRDPGRRLPSSARPRSRRKRAVLRRHDLTDVSEITVLTPRELFDRVLGDQ